MRCSKARKQLSTYLDDEFEKRGCALLEAHLAQCDQCAEELASMRRIRDLFSRAGSFSAPPAFRAEVMERVVNQPSRVYGLFPIFVRCAGAAVFLLAITAGIISGDMLITAITTPHKAAQVVASLSLDTFEALPPDSLGRAYLGMTEEIP